MKEIEEKIAGKDVAKKDPPPKDAKVELDKDGKAVKPPEHQFSKDLCK
jgi:hypothetical protein